MKKQVSIKKLMVSKGFRVTDTRTTVLQILASSVKPLDVTEIEKKLVTRGVDADQVTVYRMLDAFVEKGLITRLDFHEGKFRYELVKTDHHHVICENCGRVVDVTNCPVDSWEKEISQAQKFIITRHALEFFGLCPHCQ